MVFSGTVWGRQTGSGLLLHRFGVSGSGWCLAIRPKRLDNLCIIREAVTGTKAMFVRDVEYLVSWGLPMMTLELAEVCK